MALGRILIMLLLFQLLSELAVGQELVTLSYKICSSKDSSAIAGAKISLVDTMGNVKKVQITDGKGSASFNINGSDRKYGITVNALNHALYSSGLSMIPEKDLYDTIYLSETDITLKEVSIFQRQVYKDGEKIIYKVLQDKFSASKSTKDILSKLPGVAIVSGMVRVNGLDGVLVQIDGRGELKDQSRQLLLLGSYSSDQIDRVEIITSPSSKYDGNVNSIINIITKKVRGISNISTTVAQPLYVDDKRLGLDILSTEINSNLNFKVRDVKTSLIINASSDKGIENTFSSTNALTVLRYDNDTKTSSNNYVIRGDLTLDYDLNKRSSLALNFNLYSSPARRYQAFNSYRFFDPFNSQVDSVSTIKNNLRNVTVEYEVTGKYKYKLDDKKNSFLYFNVIYSNNFSRDNRRFEKLNSLEISENNIFKTQTNILNVSLIATDVIKSQVFNTEFGLKSNILKNHSNQFANGNTDDFEYDELIASAFLNTRFKFGGNLLVVGLRNEWINLQSDFTQNKAKGYFDDGYLKLYPNISLQKTFKNELTLSLSYNKRLRRLRSIYLNPIRLISSFYGGSLGNVANKPVYIDKVDVNLNYKSMGGAVFFQKISNQSVSLPTNDPFTSQGSNLGQFNSLGISNYFMLGNGEKKKFTSTINTDLSMVYAVNRYDDYFKKKWFTFNFSSSSEVNLSKLSQLQFELGYVMGTYSAYSKYKGLFTSSITLRQLALKEKLAINVGISDPLGIQKDRSESFYPNRYSSSGISTNNRVLTFQVLYKFSLSQKFRNQTYKIKNDGEIRH